MQVSASEGLANHTVPESCADVREGIGEALNRFLLCSDGVFKTLPEQELATLLATDADTSADRLLDAALQERADDNVTAVTIAIQREASEATSDLIS